MKYAYWYVDGTMVSSATNTLSCPYLAVGVGKHLVTVKVTPNVGKILEGSLTFAAIEGPLTLAAKPYPKNPTTFGNDQGDTGQPIYLQYFDYSHASPPTDDHIQQTQDGTAAVALPQLGTTTKTWTYGALRCPELVADPSANLSSITLQAESALTSPVTIKCHFHYKDATLGSDLEGDADDDTATTPQNPSDANSPMMVYQASVHRPKTSSIDYADPFQNFSPSDPGYGSVAAPNGNTYWAGTDYEMLLRDQLGQNMSGVWVQERFAAQPVAFMINGNADFWTTEMPPNGQVFVWNQYPSGVFKVDRVDCYWTTPFSDYVVDHTYWAATQYIDSIHTPTGIAVGTFTITWTCSLYPHQTAKP